MVRSRDIAKTKKEKVRQFRGNLTEEQLEERKEKDRVG